MFFLLISSSFPSFHLISEAVNRTSGCFFNARAAATDNQWGRAALDVFLLTLNDEVDVGGAGLVVGLDGARVWSLVGDLHLVDVDGEVAAVAVGQCDALVQGPLVRPGEQDVGAVKPGLVRHLLINPTPAREVMVTGSQKKRVEWCSIWHSQRFAA